MELIEIIAIVFVSIVVPIASYIAAGKATKKKALELLVRDAKKEQKLLDTIEGLETDVEMLKEHRESTMLTLVEISGDIKSLEKGQTDTQTMLAEIRTILIKSK